MTASLRQGAAIAKACFDTFDSKNPIIIYIYSQIYVYIHIFYIFSVKMDFLLSVMSKMLINQGFMCKEV